MTEMFDAGKLAEELRSLVSDAEALLRASASARRRASAGARRGHFAGSACPARRARGAGDRAGARYRQLRPWQPLAGRGRPRVGLLCCSGSSSAAGDGRARIACGRMPRADEPLTVGARGSAGRGLDALRTRLDPRRGRARDPPVGAAAGTRVPDRGGRVRVARARVRTDPRWSWRLWDTHRTLALTRRLTLVFIGLAVAIRRTAARGTAARPAADSAGLAAGTARRPAARGGRVMTRMADLQARRRALLARMRAAARGTRRSGLAMLRPHQARATAPRAPRGSTPRGTHYAWIAVLAGLMLTRRTCAKCCRCWCSYRSAVALVTRAAPAAASHRTCARAALRAARRTPDREVRPRVGRRCGGAQCVVGDTLVRLRGGGGTAFGVRPQDPPASECRWRPRASHVPDPQ